jgi:uncharacterized protein
MDVLLSPVILFFVLGVLAAAVRSDLSIPEPIAKGMSIYLMAAIGLKGGTEVAETGLSSGLMLAALLGVALSCVIPVWCYAALRKLGRVDAVNAGAIAAHYGSVSVVTFAAGSEMLRASALAPPGYMVAVLALMETPAIVVGLMLARRGGVKSTQSRGDLLRETLLNGPVVLLMGAFIIGLIAGKDGVKPVSPFFEAGFRGVLCIFLLDMGLIALRRLRDTRALNARLALLGVAFPIANGALAIALAGMLGLDAATAATLGILAASASYIAVPAAMRLALPQADAGLSLAMSLAVTFPFNILIGIPLYTLIAQRLVSP